MRSYTGGEERAETRTEPIFEMLQLDGVAFDFYLESYSTDEEYKIGFSESYYNELLRFGIKTEVYPMSAYLAYRDQGTPLTGAVTETIFGDGCLGNFGTPVTAENYQTASNLFCMVFTDLATQKIVGTFGVLFQTKAWTEPPTGTLWLYENGQMESKDTATILHEDSIDLRFEHSNGQIEMDISPSNSWENLYYSYEQETHPNNGPFYYSIRNSASIKKVYAGEYWSEEEAIRDNASDVTASVLERNGQSTPFGIPIEANREYEFTIIFQDGTMGRTSVEASVGSVQDDDISFRIYGTLDQKVGI